MCGSSHSLLVIFFFFFNDTATTEIYTLPYTTLFRSIAAIVCDKNGKYKVTTNHHAVGQGTVWGMWWGLLFGLLFFVPVFGMAIGAGFGALFGKLEKTGVDKAFQEQVRDMLKPGTSALFLVVEKVTPDKAVDALKQFGGTVLKTSL